MERTVIQGYPREEVSVTPYQQMSWAWWYMSIILAILEA
jgi:hypothetical protein